MPSRPPSPRAGGEGLKAAKVEMDRKVLADLAATDTVAFAKLVELAQGALNSKATAAA